MTEAKNPIESGTPLNRVLHSLENEEYERFKRLLDETDTITLHKMNFLLEGRKAIDKQGTPLFEYDETVSIARRFLGFLDGLDYSIADMLAYHHGF